LNLHTLSNGLRVVADPVPGLQTFALSVVVRGGARWEDEARSGWSHLLEHMVFKGAGGRDARALAEAVEAEGGQLNAMTGYERTSYQVRGLAGTLATALEITADMLHRPTLDPEELEREKAVVGQEIAEAFDTPDDWVFELAQGAAFAGQPLGRPILGTAESLAPVDRAALEAWRAVLYAPERTVVAVSGAVDEDELLRLAERAFGDAPPALAATEPEPARFVGGAATLARRIEQANLVWYWPAPSVRDPLYWAAPVFAEILGGGMASRLFQEAREKRGLAYSIDAWHDPFEDAGLIGVFAGCAPADAAPLSALVEDAVRRLGDGPAAGELARAKAQARAHLFMGQEQTAGRAERAAAQVLLFGRTLTVEEVAVAMEAVGVDDLRAVGERMLAAERPAIAALGPKAALRAAGRGARTRALAPA
jgi:predicted Zn-dependent peptidase